MLYEGLTRAIEINPKLTSHFLTFIDWHFRNYFDIDPTKCVINFKQIVREFNGRLEVWDNLGKLIIFVSSCIVTCDQHSIGNDNQCVISLLSSLLDRVDSITLAQLEISENVDQRSKEIGIQFVQCMEGLMAFAVMAATTTNGLMEKFYKVFQHHQKIIGELKNIFGEKKSGKKTKANSNPITSTPNTTSETPLPHTQYTISATINLTTEQAIQFKPTNVWDINIIQKLLSALFK